MTFAAHWPDIELPPLRQATREPADDVQWMAPAPKLPSVLDDEAVVVTSPPSPTPSVGPPPATTTEPPPAPTPSVADPVLAGFTELHARLVAVRQEYLDSQTASLEQFLAMQERVLAQLANVSAGTEVADVQEVSDVQAEDSPGLLRRPGALTPSPSPGGRGEQDLSPSPPGRGVGVRASEGGWQVSEGG